MNSLEPELLDLHTGGAIDSATATRAVALERREIFSLYGELRASMYCGVLLLTSGVGLLIKNNGLGLGPAGIIAVLGLAAGGCYGIALRARFMGRRHTVVADYVLLLGALLLSADLGYAESEFHLLGAHWSWHLLLLTLAHAAAAYAFESPLLLTAALTTLVGWLGVTGGTVNLLGFSQMTAVMAIRGFVAAAVVLAWRMLDRRRPGTRFSDTFDHFCANLSFWAALAWCTLDSWRLAGLCIVALLAVISIWRGLRSASEAFVVYAVGYSALALAWVVVSCVRDSVLGMTLVLLIVTVAAIVLWNLHRRLRKRAG